MRGELARARSPSKASRARRGLRADGSGEARTRLQAAALRGLTRFVGRDAEVEHLRRVLSQAGAGHGQVVAIVGEAGVGKSRLRLRVHPLASGAGVADPGGLLRLLRQGHQLPAGDRPAQGLLQDRRPRRSSRDARQGAGARAGPGPRARTTAAPAARSARRAGRGRGLAEPRPAPAPPAHARRGQAPAAAREPGATAARGVRGSALGRWRDPGPARQPGGEPGLRPPAAAGQLPPRVRAPLGQQDRVLPAAARQPARRERGRAAGGAARPGPRARTAHADAGEARQSVLPGGDGAHAGGDGRAGRESAERTG